MPYHDFTCSSNHYQIVCRPDWAQFKSFRDSLIIQRQNCNSTHQIRINEITRNTSLNHSKMENELSHVPFNRVGDAKSTAHVYAFSLSVNMTYASIGSTYVQWVYEKCQFLHLSPQFVNLQLESCGIRSLLIVTTVLIGYYDYHPVTKLPKIGSYDCFSNVPNSILLIQNYRPVRIISL